MGRQFLSHSLKARNREEASDTDMTNERLKHPKTLNEIQSYFLEYYSFHEICYEDNIKYILMALETYILSKYSKVRFDKIFYT
jgi:hypothetical protein